MVALHIYDDEAETKDFAVAQRFLSKEGIQIGRFRLNDLAQELSQYDTLTDNQRSDLVDSYPEIQKKYSAHNGYRSDVVCLYPEFEHFDFIMSKFGNIHFHFENEYWYFIDGFFGFVFINDEGRKYVVTIEAGEFIQVPEGKWQFFSGTREQRMKAIRYFNTTNKFSRPDKIDFSEVF